MFVQPQIAVSYARQLACCAVLHGTVVLVANCTAATG